MAFHPPNPLAKDVCGVTVGSIPFADPLGCLSRDLNDFTVIQTKADLPTPVSGEIIMPDGYYRINGAIVLGTDKIVIPEDGLVRFEGFDAFRDGFIYTGTGALFNTDAGKDITAFDTTQLFVSTPNGAVYNMVTPITSIAFVFAFTFATADCDSLGTIEGLGGVLMSFNGFRDFGDGLILKNVDNITMGQSIFERAKNTGGTFFTFEGTIKTFGLVNIVFEPDSTEFVFDIKSTLTIDVGTVADCQFLLDDGGTVFAAGSKDQTDVNLEFNANVNVKDSVSFANNFMITNVTATVTSAQNDPKKVAGTWTPGLTERFTPDTTGRSTSNAIRKVDLQVISTFRGIGSAGANKDFSFYFVIGNDTNNTITAFANNGAGGTTVTSAAHGKSNGDRLPITNTTSYNGTQTIFNVTTNTFDIPVAFVADDATGNWALLIETSKMPDSFDNADERSVTVVAIICFDTDDYVELFAENNTDSTTDITIDSARILVR